MKKQFFAWIKEHLKTNPDSAAVLCDLGYPEALEIQKLYPTRVINAGVAEQNAALVAKGLCSEGFEVFLYGVSSFTLWRSAEVFKLYFSAGDRSRVVGNGGGFGYGVMGSTHHGLDDLGLVSLWKSWTSWIPERDADVSEVLNRASAATGPQYLRLTNNAHAVPEKFQEIKTAGQGQQITVVSFGPLWDTVSAGLASDQDLKFFGINKWPVDFSEIQKHFEKSKKIIFFEEHELDGGLSQKMAASLEGPRQNIYIHAAQKTTVNGSRNFLLERQGFAPENMRALVLQLKESCR